MKNKKYLLILILSFMLLIPGSKAFYNGSGGVLNSGGLPKNCTGTNWACFNEHKYLQIKVVYVDSTAPLSQRYEFMSQTYIVAQQKGYDYAKNVVGFPEGKIIKLDTKNVKSNDKNKQKYIDAANTYNNLNPSDKNWYMKASTALKQWFGDEQTICNSKDCPMNYQLYLFLRGALGTNDIAGKLTRDTEVADPTGKNPAKKGYRIVIEPVVVYAHATWANGGKAYATPKEAAYAKLPTAGCSKPLASDKKCSGNNSPTQAQYLFTTFDDVGVAKASKEYCSGINTTQLANYNDGCGMNIIDIGKFKNTKICYVRKYTGSISCDGKYDVKNEKDFKEEFTPTLCSSIKDESNVKEDDNYYTADGKLYYNKNSCKVYCKEKVHVVFPTSLTRTSTTGEKISFGSYFPWPTKENGRMPLSITEGYDCKVPTSCSSNDIESIKNTLPALKLENGKPKNVSVKLNAGDFNEINEDLTSIVHTIKVNDTRNSNGMIEFAREIGLEINENTNRYFNKNDNTVSSAIPKSAHVDRNEGVVSLAPYNSTKLKDVRNYELKLTNIKLGTLKISDYVCKLEVSGSCACPPGTNMHGLDLSEIENASGKSCVELQKTACDCACPEDSSKPGELYDSEKAPTGFKNITDLKGQKMVDACKNWQRTYCYPCLDKNTGEKVEISSCIDEKFSEYKTKYTEKRAMERAEEYCNQKYCPPYCDDSNGNHIDLSDCMYKEGKSYLMCYNEKCNKMPCPSGICVDDVCTEDCKWTYSGGKYGKYIKKCNNQGDKDNCGYINNACNDEKTIKDKLKIKLNGSDVITGLNKGLITPADVRSAITECAGDNKKVVYRSVDLNNPFLTKSGSERIPGENWNSNQVVKTEIKEGRGTNGYGLYNKEPLYTITLTPNTINKIKKYNESNNYSDFNLDCENDSKCVSTYLQKLKQDGIVTSKISYCSGLTSGNKESNFDSCYNENN